MSNHWPTINVEPAVYHKKNTMKRQSLTDNNLIRYSTDVFLFFCFSVEHYLVIGSNKNSTFLQLLVSIPVSWDLSVLVWFHFVQLSQVLRLSSSSTTTTQSKKVILGTESVLKTSTYRPHSSAVSGPTSWNSLPQSFRDATPTLGQFQRRLKTPLFRLAYSRDLTAHSWLSRLLERCTINVRTELNWNIKKITPMSARCKSTALYIKQYNNTIEENKIKTATLVDRHGINPTSPLSK